MNGGKQYRSFHKNNSSQDTQCIYKDTYTFCKYLASILDTVEYVTLFYSVDVYKVLSQEEASKFLIMLTKSDATKGSTITTTFKSNIHFARHIINILTVKSILDEIHHPFIPIVQESKGKHVYGFKINYVKKQPTYHTFQQVCDQYIDTMKFTSATYNQLYTDISNTIDTALKKGYVVNGVSHQTIGYFKEAKRFKVIDWQYLSSIDNQKHNGYLLYSHPLKSYLNGVASLIAKRNMEIGSLLLNNRWVRRMKSYQQLNAFGKASIIYILETHKKKELPLFIKHFDKYALGLLLILIAEKNNIVPQEDTITKLFKPFIPRL